MTEIKKILIVGQHWRESLGGGYTHVIDIVNKLVKDGYEVVVISSITEIKRSIIEKRKNLKCYYISPVLNSRFLSFFLYELWVMRKIIKMEKPDIINIHSTVPDYGPVGIGLDFPGVLTVHGVACEEKKYWKGIKGLIRGFFVQLTEGFVISRYTHIIVDTEYVTKQISKFSHGKIYENPIGIEKRWFDINSNPIPGLVIAVGGIERRKGYDFLINSWKLVNEKMPEAKLRIIGGVRNKSYYDELKTMADNYGLGESITFAGFVNDVSEELEKASLYVMSSAEESQGIAITEAMATGTPVVASRIGGIPYIFGKDTGMMVEYGDTKAMSESILKLLGDAELRKKCGDNAKLHASQLTADNTYIKYINVLKSSYLDRNNPDIKE